MNQNSDLLSLSKLSCVPLLGHVRSIRFLSKVIQEQNVAVKGKGFKNCDLYSQADVEQALKNHEKTKPNFRNGSGCAPVFGADLRTKKTEREIEKLENDITKQNLEIQRLKGALIDGEEVLKYLLVRKAIEAACLRRLLFVQMPIEVPGLSIPKARERGEQYYNEIMETLSQTIQLWEKKYQVKLPDLEKQLEQAVKETV